ncbi:MAG TPA: toxin-antitoxin system HicB family antitoxin [Gemmatimonadales bacterium]
MAERKTFLLRLDPAVHEALQRWAAAELRSLNGQIEFVLRRALQQSGRLVSGTNEGGAGFNPPKE